MPKQPAAEDEFTISLVGEADVPVNPELENKLALALAQVASAGPDQPLQQIMCIFLNEMAAAGYTIVETKKWKQVHKALAFVRKDAWRRVRHYDYSEPPPPPLTPYDILDVTEVLFH